MDDAFATGSSLMPQKKNPDVLELIRGQAGLIIGHQTALLTVMKGLPLSYNRDLQWDKRFVIEAVDASLEGLQVLARLLRHVTVRVGRAARLLSDDLCATDLAEYLVGRGTAFGEAHAVVGRLVAYAQAQRKPLGALRLQELQRFSPRLNRAALAVINPARSVARKRGIGSTNPVMVKRALIQWKKRLS